MVFSLFVFLSDQYSEQKGTGHRHWGTIGVSQVLFVCLCRPVENIFIHGSTSYLPVINTIVKKKREVL